MTQNVAGKKPTSKTKIQASRTFQPIHLVKADDGAVAVPTRIEVVRAGTWPNSVKGNLTISTADLEEMKANFDAGISQPYPGFGIPIDFSHADYAEAAGWITNLDVQGNVLYADVDWSDTGEEALRGGRFKCFSPAFYPGCIGEYHDPEDLDVTARNVLEGGGLTNIPFFKGLTPIKASTTEQSDGDKNVLYINEVKASEKENYMTLAEVLAKENDALTEDERTFLAEHKEELSAEDKQKFGFEAPADAASESEEQEEEAAGEEAPAAVAEELPEAVTASLKKNGFVVIKADRLNALEKTAGEYKHDKAAEAVTAHVARGAIKADQVEAWTNRVMADDTVLDLLKHLPDNQVLASEAGKTDSGAEVTAAHLINKKASEKIAAAKKDGVELKVGDAMSQVMREDADLAARYEEELKG